MSGLGSAKNIKVEKLYFYIAHPIVICTDGELSGQAKTNCLLLLDVCHNISSKCILLFGHKISNIGT